MKVKVGSRFTAANLSLQGTPASEQHMSSTSQRHSRGTWEPETPPPSSHTPAPEPNAGTVRFITYSEPTIRAFRSLHEEAIILLLTPAVAPPADTDSHDGDLDPFENFGRSLSKYYQRIRHVPFEPEEPLSDTHAVFLQKADAVIVVCCEAPSLSQGTSQRPSASDLEILNGQLRFIRQVRDVLTSSESRSGRSHHKPLLVGASGSKGSFLDRGVEISQFGTVIFCPYEARALVGLGEWIHDACGASGNPSPREKRSLPLRPTVKQEGVD